MTSLDVLVVGAGPIGVETAIALAAEGRSVAVVDSGPVGATIARTFPPHTRWFSSPERLEMRGHRIHTATQEKLTGEEYLAYLRGVVDICHVDVRTYARVIAIAGAQGDFQVTTRTPAGREDVLTARHLVLATGGTDRPRTLGIPGEDLPHVHHYLGDPHRFFGRRVLVVGGRNSAAESALRLTRIGADVALSYRGPEVARSIKFWLRPEIDALLAEGVITGYLPSELAAISPQEVDLADGRVVPVDDVLLQIGFEQDPEIFRMAGVALRDEPGRPPSVDPATMQTNVPGVFVVGTATAGTQDRFGIYVENCHQHADRVAAHLAGRPAPAPVPDRPLPEA